MKRTIFILLMSSILAVSCGGTDNRKTLSSGVVLIGKSTAADDAFFDTMFNNMASMIEKKDITGIMGFFSDDYEDANDAKKGDIEKGQRDFFALYDKLTMVVKKAVVTISSEDPKKAYAIYDYLLTGEKTGEKKEYKCREKLMLEKQGEKWLIIFQLGMGNSEE